ncbi:RNA polymerase sigma-54 factor [Chlamydiales bacterium STE3]|nr:RNA polymerase sigma-54 factor [Chlamydiales bacterium STE3]
MSYPIFLRQQLTPEQSLKQTQRLMMTPEMQQAIHFLQLPVQELATLIDAEIEQNPILEYSIEDEANEEENWEEETVDQTEEKEIDFDEYNLEILKQLDEDFRDHFSESGPYIKDREEDKKKNYLESSIPQKLSLYDCLMIQAKEVFVDDQLHMAEAVIGYLDNKGFLNHTLAEIAALFEFNEKDLKEVLKVIQTFEPSGVGATHLQESLLIQLTRLHKESSLAYRLVEDHFADLIHNRIPNIQKQLRCTAKEIRQAIEKDVAKLDLHPGMAYSKEITPYITPDAQIHQEGESLIVYVNDDTISPLRLNSKYLKLLEDPHLPPETKQFIKLKILSARWLVKNISQRNDTIRRIAEAIASRQRQFFIDPNGRLMPLTMKMLANELDLHESTIARAVSNKYIATPRGILPIRYFFSNTYVSDEGEDISANTVKEVLAEIVKNEDKSRPLSDQAISKLIKLRGISCARRTIAKYRAELNIGNASQRKRF